MSDQTKHESSGDGGRGAPAKDRPIAFNRRGTAWSEVTKLSETTFRVRLGGLFQTAWMATLCSRLADQRISIDHTHARLTHDESWIAELHIVLLSGAPDPMSLPYVGFAEAEAPRPVVPPELDAYRLIESRDYGGTLMLTFEAADSLGLLGSLLVSLAGLALFPVEMHIETRAGCAYDCLWLGAEGGAVPSLAARDSLDRMLASLLRGFRA